jgi:hypothetical protein
MSNHEHNAFIDRMNWLLERTPCDETVEMNEQRRAIHMALASAAECGSAIANQEA